MDSEAASKSEILASSNEIIDLVRDLPTASRQQLFRKRPELRKAEINSSGTDSSYCAVVEIQRVWRGYNSRLNSEKMSMRASYSGSRSSIERVEDFHNEPIKLMSRRRLEEKYDSFLTDEMDKSVDYHNIMSFPDFAAQSIQKQWADYRQRESSKKLVTARSSERSTGGRSSAHHQQHRAAVTIQKMWRRHIDREVYQYYKDLINFHHRGDPAIMLRCINPREAQLADPASGIHIRFRLAGENFPPNIYYKIYTHRTVIDMCANSPKDYAQTKLPPAKKVHNRCYGDLNEGKDGWYRRIENNGWRLVSDRIINQAMSDPITFHSSRKKIDFPCSKLQRQQDVQKKKRARKIEWMRKMYINGMMQVKAEDVETAQLVHNVANGMLTAIEDSGQDTVEDWEVDQLLEWTTGLNFDRYAESWKKMATSSVSEKPIDVRVESSDPYTFTISTSDTSVQNPLHRFTASDSSTFPVH